MEDVTNHEHQFDRGRATRHEPPGATSSEAELLSGLGSDSWRQEMVAQRTLTEMGERALPLLIDGLRSGSDQTRWGAAKLLRDLHSPAAIPPLVDALEDPNPGVRWLAAEALAATGSDALVPLLDRLATHADSMWLLEGAHHVLRGIDAGLAAPVVRALEGHFADLAVPVASHEVLKALGSGRSGRQGRQERGNRAPGGAPDGDPRE